VVPATTRDAGLENSAKKTKLGKRQQEMDTSEQALLKATQLLSALACPDTAATVLPKRLQAMSDLLKSRLRESLIQLYAEDYHQEAQDGTRCGMDILEEIRNVQTKVESMKALVEQLHCPTIDVGSLSDAIDGASLGGCTIPEVILRLAWGRLAQAKFDAKEFDAWSRTLLPTSLDLPPAFGTMGQKQVFEFQEAHIVDCLLILIRAEGMADVVKAAAVSLNKARRNAPAVDGRVEVRVFCAASHISLRFFKMIKNMPHASQWDMTSSFGGQYTCAVMRLGARLVHLHIFGPLCSGSWRPAYANA
jgi:hypothetical protein